MTILNLQTAIDLIVELQRETFHRSTALHEAVERYFGIPSAIVDDLYNSSLHKLAHDGPDKEETDKFRAEYIAKLEAMYELGSDTPPRKQ